MRETCLSIFAAILVCATTAAPAFAVREFPADARRANFTVITYPTVQLGRHALSLAPGAQIRDTTNQIVMPTSLSGKYPALYTLDGSGQVYRVWLLTDEEVAWLKSQRR